MLTKYGIVNNNTRSNDILRRLDNLGLVKDKHYLLRKFSEQVNSGVFDDMVQNGLISAKDKDDLKTIAKVENVDTSNLHDPDSDEE